MFAHWLGVFTQQVLAQQGEVFTQCLHSGKRFRSQRTANVKLPWHTVQSISGIKKPLY